MFWHFVVLMHLVQNNQGTFDWQIAETRKVQSSLECKETGQQWTDAQPYAGEADDNVAGPNTTANIPTARFICLDGDGKVLDSEQWSEVQKALRSVKH